jgi:hypothetical protein
VDRLDRFNQGTRFQFFFADLLRSQGKHPIGHVSCIRGTAKRHHAYVYAIKKVASYVYVMKKFPSMCMSRTRSSLTYMPFWMDGELTEVLEGV